MFKVDDIHSELIHENATEGTFSRQVIELAMEKNVDLIIISSEHTVMYQRSDDGNP